MARGIVRKLLFRGAKSFASGLRQGHIWVYVGMEEPQKFELEANFLNHHLFENLLRLSVEEFGYSYHGALRIACDVELFVHVRQLLRSSNPSVHYMELQSVMESFYASRLKRWHPLTL